MQWGGAQQWKVVVGSIATTQGKAVSSAFPELLAPSRNSAAAQTEMLLKHMATQVSVCGKYEGTFWAVESGSKQPVGKRDQTDDLLCLVAKL